MKIHSAFALAALRSAIFSFAVCAGALLIPQVSEGADFTTAEGYAATCKDMGDKPSALTSDDERVAFVICHDTTLVRQIITWGTQGYKQMSQGQTQDAGQSREDVILKQLYAEVDYTRAQLALTRGVLEQIRLGDRKSLRLVPAQWQMDLNGDGKMELWEQYFFAIPKRKNRDFAVTMPSNAQEYYDKEYQLDAAIEVDQSDILWALSYHEFIEGLLTNLRAFDFNKTRQVVLSKPELLRQAYQLIAQGIANSEKLRLSVLAETSDEEEWIGNPSQTSSVFPVALDAQDFITWGNILSESSAIWKGQHLLPMSRNHGLISELAVCEDGSGLNLAQLYLHPPRNMTVFPPPEHLKSPLCQKIDARHPLSTLPAMIEHARRSDPGMQFLRLLYWTN